MPNSLQNELDSNTHNRLCDFCSESIALLYCRADSAKLCFSCDHEVHSTNQLFTKHTRFQLCDNCDSSAATIFCSTEQSVLCQNCDFELHRSCFANHDRRPLEGFSGCPSVCELQGFVGFEGFGCKSLIDGDGDGDGDGDCDEKEGFDGGLLGGLLEEESDGFFDGLVWDTPSFVSIDELILSTDASHNFHAMVVPPLPKDKNLSCGKHKQEILHQLRELAKSKPNAKQDSVPLLRNQTLADQNETDFTIEHMFRHYQHVEEHATLRGHEARSFSCANDADDAADDLFLSSVLLGSHNEEDVPSSDRHSTICSSVNLVTNELSSHDPINSESLIFTQKVPKLDVSSADRDSALSRYKEKRRTRRYEKHIRYESRKAQAENRTRIRGRFAKDRPPCEPGMMNPLGKNR